MKWWRRWRCGRRGHPLGKSELIFTQHRRAIYKQTCPCGLVSRAEQRDLQFPVPR